MPRFHFMLSNYFQMKLLRDGILREVDIGAKLMIWEEFSLKY